MLFEALHGSQFEASELGETQTRAWGRALARLHAASRSFPIHPARPALTDHIQSLVKTLPPQEHILRENLIAGQAWLMIQPDQPYGLIHGDFETDNLVWDGVQLAALDFDDASYAWHAVDIAIAVYDIRDDHTRLSWFLEGYADLLPVPVGLRETLPDFHNVLLAVKIARLVRAYATTTGGEQPGWLIAMRARHEAWLAAHKARLMTC